TTRPHSGRSNGPSSLHRQATDVLSAGELLEFLRSFKKGRFDARLPIDRAGLAGEIAMALNDVIEMNAQLASELAEVSRIVGKEGRVTRRVTVGNGSPGAGGWASIVESVNGLITDLVQPTTEVGRV